MKSFTQTLLILVLIGAPALARAADLDAAGASAAAEQLSAKAADNLKALKKLHGVHGLEAALARSYASELDGGPVDSTSLEELKLAVSYKRKYWRSVSDALNAQWDSQYKDDQPETARGSSEQAVREKVAKAKARFKLSAKLGMVSAVIKDAQDDAALLEAILKTPAISNLKELGDQAIARKAKLFTSMRPASL